MLLYVPPYKNELNYALDMVYNSYAYPPIRVWDIGSQLELREIKSPVAVLGGGGGLICLPCGVFFITSNPFGIVLATTNITGPHVMFPSSLFTPPNYWVLFLTMNERV